MMKQKGEGGLMNEKDELQEVITKMESKLKELKEKEAQLKAAQLAMQPNENTPDLVFRQSASGYNYVGQFKIVFPKELNEESILSAFKHYDFVCKEINNRNMGKRP